MYDLDILHKGILERFPEESCGFILEDWRVVFCENVSETPTSSFKIASEAYSEYLGRIKFIFHSHCIDSSKAIVLDPRTPSLKDMEMQELTGIEWLIFATEGWTVTEPVSLPRVPSRDYLGRPFIWFINDCYTLVQDYFKFELKIELKPYVLHDYTKVRKTNKVFDEFIGEYGFKELFNLEDLRNGDLFILDNSGFTENHLGIYHNGKLLHQGMVSVEESMENYIGRIKKRLRYVG